VVANASGSHARIRARPAQLDEFNEQNVGVGPDAINRADIWRYILKPIEVEELKILVKQSFDYYAILKENRALLKILRQQAQWISTLKEKHPQVLNDEMKQSADYAVGEKHVSEIIEDFMKKYYPDEKKG